MRYRTLLSFAFSLSGLFMVAQTAGLRSFEASTALERSSLKFVIQAVMDLDPTAAVFHSDDMRIIQVRSSAEITDAAIRTALSGAGVQLREGTPDLSAYLPPRDANAPPVFIATGDEPGDLLRYQTSVSTWNQAHPDRSLSLQPLHLNDR